MKLQSVTPENLACLSPLAGLGAESLLQVASLAKLESFPRGLQALNFSWTHKLVYLLDGELKLGYPGGGNMVVVGGYDAALSPLNGGGVDPVNVRAITDIQLLWFDENALDILVTWDQLASPLPARADSGVGSVDALGENGDAADWRAMSGIFDAQHLTRGTFANLPAANIDSLLAGFKRQFVKAGEVIVRQNDPGDYYYVIERGRAQVTREVAGAQIELAELKSGDAFGEEALIAETSRNATVTMQSDGELLRLDGADFVRLLRAPLLQSIAAAEARRRVAAGACWLDVRLPVEFRHDGLPGALNIPLNVLRDASPKLQKDREYIVYCQSGRRSSAATFLLSQRGLHASLLQGGLKSMIVMETQAA